MQKKVVVIEYCKNCKSHNWNTRHDESRYANCFLEFQHTLTKAGIEVQSATQYRLGAFEISIQNYEIFSKIKSYVFPDVDSVSKFIIQFFQQEQKDKFSSLLQNDNNNNNKKKRVSLNPGLARVSKFFSPNKVATTYKQMFNAQKQLKRSKISNRIIFSNNSNISLQQKRSLQRMRHSSVSNNDLKIYNPEKNLYN